jgi:hypothetical protein
MIITKEVYMKTSMALLSMLLLGALLVSGTLFAIDTRVKPPMVAYLRPDDESTVDLTGKQALKFEWKSVPIPVNGRESYKITVYKGFGYDVVFSQVIDPRTFSVDVPTEKFEDGATYTWHVRQRDMGNMQWSRFDSWSFKVVKK